MQQQVVHSVSAIVQSRVAQLENNFASLSGNLKRRLVTQTQLSLFEQALSENTLERIQARHQLIDNLFYITGTSTSDHLLFYYLADSDEFLTGVHSNYIPFSQQNAIFNEIRRRIADGYQPASNSSRWILLQADERYYALLLYRYQNMWVGGCIPADILIQPLNDIYLDGQSIPVPVSYTHLDVYKRQAFHPFPEMALEYAVLLLNLLELGRVAFHARHQRFEFFRVAGVDGV